MGKRRLALLPALMLILMIMTACGKTPQADVSMEETEESIDKQSSADDTTEYEVQETIYYRDNMKISGELLLPEVDAPMPLIIMSHGFGGNRENVRGYAKRFAENGIAAYIFDFIGGGRNIKSDGKTTEMSVLTEAADLEVLLDELREDERFDSGKIFLFGESQGGYVSTYVAGERSSDIAGLIVLYPAYVIGDDAGQRGSDQDESETMSLMGTTISGKYNADALSVDIYEKMRSYKGKTLIIHGTSDSIVPISYSERAEETFSDARLIRYDGADHGFYGNTGTRAANDSLEFVLELLKIEREVAGVGKFDLEKKTVMLNSGYEMPVIGLGTWTLNDDEAENSVYHALKSGMRLIDTARYYGNEAGVGRGIKKAIDEGIVTREEIFITTKIYGGDYERAGGIIDEALDALNVEYVDLLLIHQPGSDDEGVYKAMEEAVSAGKLRSIGISNYYTREQVEEVLAFATITPAVIQNENHLYYQNTELQEYVRQYGIVIESWYPFGGREHTSESFNNDTIIELAEKYDKSSAQIILRWQLQAGFIAIPGSANPDHIAENYDIFDFELTGDEMHGIRSLDRQERYENW